MLAINEYKRVLELEPNNTFYRKKLANMRGFSFFRKLFGE